jgi:hypothetical protein
VNDEQPRGNWYLLTGLILGLILGLVLSLQVFPVRYENSDPSMLADDQRGEYRRLIAEAYRSDGNLPRAQQRLALLRDEDPVRALAAQAQRILADGGGPDDARPLAQLAAALNGAPQQTGPTATVQAPDQAETPAQDEATENPVPGEPTPAGTIDLGEAVRTPTPILPTETPLPTFTPRPSATPPRVLDAPFSLVSRTEVCDGSGNLPAEHIAVEVRDQQGHPLAGVKIAVAWDGGSDTFYTGLVPEINLGYADFKMQPGGTYSLRAGDAGDLVGDLSIPACGGAWKLEFQEGAR